MIRATEPIILDDLEIKSVLLNENRGFGAAVNLGAQKAEYKHLFILNPDTMVPGIL